MSLESTLGKALNVVTNFDGLEDKQTECRMRCIGAGWEETNFKDPTTGVETPGLRLIVEWQPLDWQTRDGNNIQTKIKYSNRKDSMYGHFLQLLKALEITIKTENFQELWSKVFICEKREFTFGKKKDGTVMKSNPVWFPKSICTEVVGSVAQEINLGAPSEPVTSKADEIDESLMRDLKTKLIKDGMTQVEMENFRSSKSIPLPSFKIVIDDWTAMDALYQKKSCPGKYFLDMPEDK